MEKYEHDIDFIHLLSVIVKLWGSDIQDNHREFTLALAVVQEASFHLQVYTTHTVMHLLNLRFSISAS